MVEKLFNEESNNQNSFLDIHDEVSSTFDESSIAEVSGSSEFSHNERIECVHDPELSCDNYEKSLRLKSSLCIKVHPRSKREITVKDHFLAVLGISVKHKLSYEATLDIMRWIKMSHETANLPITKTYLWKILNRENCDLIYHLYCK